MGKAQLLLGPLLKTHPPPPGMAVRFTEGTASGETLMGAVEEEGNTRLASQVGHINPGGQRGKYITTRSPSHAEKLFILAGGGAQGRRMT